MIKINYDEFISESIMFSNSDLVLNLDKWKVNSSNNILYVTGLSGSGKTTLAEKYEKQYNHEGDGVVNPAVLTIETTEGDTEQ